MSGTAHHRVASPNQRRGRGFHGSLTADEAALGCEWCGKQFERKHVLHVFCSKPCMSKARRGTDTARGYKQLEGGSRGEYTVTVTGRNEAGRWHSSVGWGKNRTAAKQHAHEQLSDELGEFEVMSHSTPDSIFRDLIRETV